MHFFLNFNTFILLFAFIQYADASRNTGAVSWVGHENDGFIGERYHVYIINQLSRTSLFLHCKSADDDLGGQDIAIGQQKTWAFRENLNHTTLFWCYFRQANQEMNHEVFNDRNDEMLEMCDRNGHKNCVWKVKDDGVYLLNIPRSMDTLMYKWTQT